ncbi:synaptonemal complex central element protein 1 isoform X2 [Ictalurus punctatus]|uniref:Synaptonemal complex central element protein 1 isoform X2 n=1 Tax=Ictalurus punctatus TaxID=7998 RepID=A0A9F7R9T5_ICTPU|nr:synaptonemal complex central element protein 1 isoform X2 [Ictalurus punctatus]
MSVVESSFNVEDVFRFPQAPGREKDLKIEELLSKLRKLQQVKLVLEEEVKEALSLCSTLRDEDNALTAEILQLQGILSEKEETCRSLQFKLEDLEQESQKMKFENQLQQLIGQHKNFCTLFTPERIPTEIQSAEYATEQLLKAEKQKVEQVENLQEELSNAQSTNMPQDAKTAAW